MIEIILLIFAVSYREVGILCDRGSWGWARFQKIFPKTDQTNFWKKNWDWFHVSNGLSTLIMCHLFAEKVYLLFGNVWIDTPFYWLLWMYIRNLVIHIIIPLPEYRRHWFALPLVGGYLDNKYRK